MDWDEDMQDANSVDDSYTTEDEQELDNDDDYAADYVFDNDDDSDSADADHQSSSANRHQVLLSFSFLEIFDKVFIFDVCMYACLFVCG